MKIESLHISQFGPLEELRLGFQERGIHVIAGGAGAGKTHVIAAIIQSFIGSKFPFVLRNQDDGPCGSISMRAAWGNRTLATQLILGKQRLESIDQSDLSELFIGSLSRRHMPRLVLDFLSMRG